ncbi:MAG: tRNA epoxyqueuosine(34) reductase QueG [Magnetococcales bacterium]|nr:tRNA epoxyqueuosine(34) reductase QueG [Magnetococcales bacterium]
MSKSTNPWEQRKEALRRQALAMGFAMAGFAPVRPPPHAQALQPWLDQGCHGGMAWLARDPQRRADPGHWMEGDGVILVLGFNLAPGPAQPGEEDGDQGVIAAYARRRDYHDVLKQKVQELAIWLEGELGHPVWHRLFVDTGAVLEKPLATAAGLGWQGKNALLVTRGFGGWLMLAELFLGLPFSPDPVVVTDHCGTCDRCQRACPTGALSQAYRVDASRCLAYFTVESREPIPREYREALGNRIFGCDVCIRVCPWNRFAPVTSQAPVAGTLRSLMAWAALDGVAFQGIFRGTPVKRVGLTRFLRNVATALGNGQDPDGLWSLQRLLRHEAPMVRMHAAWGLGKRMMEIEKETGLHSNQNRIMNQIKAWLQERLTIESDDAVKAEIESALSPGSSQTH